MELRSPQITDSKEISDLLIDTFQNVNSSDYNYEQIQAWVNFDNPNQIQEIIENKDLRTFLAIDNEEIVGFLSLSINQSLLTSLYIKHTKIGQGFGSELLELAENILKERGKRQIKLNSSKTAKAFYKKKATKKKKN